MERIAVAAAAVPGGPSDREMQNAAIIESRPSKIVRTMAPPESCKSVSPVNGTNRSCGSGGAGGALRSRNAKRRHYRIETEQDRPHHGSSRVVQVGIASEWNESQLRQRRCRRSPPIAKCKTPPLSNRDRARSSAPWLLPSRASRYRQ